MVMVVVDRCARHLHKPPTRRPESVSSSWFVPCARARTPPQSREAHRREPSPRRASDQPLRGQVGLCAPRWISHDSATSLHLTPRRRVAVELIRQSPQRPMLRYAHGGRGGDLLGDVFGAEFRPGRAEKTTNQVASPPPGRSRSAPPGGEARPTAATAPRRSVDAGDRPCKCHVDLAAENP